MVDRFLKNLTRAQIIAGSFFVVIFIGTLLLLLPFATRSGESTSFLDALFTATSSTCVTGLVVFNTYAHWTIFGQIVILALIQIGGIGFMTIITMVTVFLRRKKLGLKNRMIIMESAGNTTLSGIGQLVRKIINGTLLFEGIGAVLLSTQLIPRFGWRRGIFASVFHSISAFCNAGFDVMGESSFCSEYDNVVINITLIMLIVIGGIGFMVWSDIAHCGFKIKKYKLHTKLVLVTTAVLIISGWLLFFVFEYDHAFSEMTVPKKILAALFQSVTTRTAGFNTVSMSSMSESGSIVTILLMFIGGSPGSTAGGVKTTTVAILVLSTIAYTQSNHDVTIFRKRIEDNMVRRASAITSIYFALISISTLIICAIEKLSFQQVLFEVVSAAGTVGLSMDVTPTLSFASKIILITLMYAGRIGALTFILILSRKQSQDVMSRPTGKIMIG